MVDHMVATIRTDKNPEYYELIRCLKISNLSLLLANFLRPFPLHCLVHFLPLFFKSRVMSLNRDQPSRKAPRDTPRTKRSSEHRDQRENPNKKAKDSVKKSADLDEKAHQEVLSEEEGMCAVES